MYIWLAISALSLIFLWSQNASKSSLGMDGFGSSKGPADLMRWFAEIGHTGLLQSITYSQVATQRRKNIGVWKWCISWYTQRLKCLERENDEKPTELRIPLFSSKHAHVSRKAPLLQNSSGECVLNTLTLQQTTIDMKNLYFPSEMDHVCWICPFVWQTSVPWIFREYSTTQVYLHNFSVKSPVMSIYVNFTQSLRRVRRVRPVQNEDVSSSMMTPPLEKAGWWAGLAAAPRTLGLLFHWGEVPFSGGLEPWNFMIFHSIGNSNPNWLIFFRGVGIPPSSFCRLSPFTLLCSIWFVTFKMGIH